MSNLTVTVDNPTAMEVLKGLPKIGDICTGSLCFAEWNIRRDESNEGAWIVEGRIEPQITAEQVEEAFAKASANL